MPCPSGSYNNRTGVMDKADCLLCTEGTSCPTTGMSAPGDLCPLGYYCPQGTSFPTTFPCPPGTLGSSIGLTTIGLCTVCPATYYCDWGTGGLGDPNPPLACPTGHYCPQGTGYAFEFECPPGTYGPNPSQDEDTDCIECPAGRYCVGGQAHVTGVCATGHYCPAGTNHSRRNPCPAGTYTDATNIYAAR